MLSSPLATCSTNASGSLVHQSISSLRNTLNDNTAANVSPPHMRRVKDTVVKQTDDQVWDLADEVIICTYSVDLVIWFCGTSLICGLAALCETWRSKTYEHYEVSMRCIHQGSWKQIQYIYKCKFKAKDQIGRASCRERV